MSTVTTSSAASAALPEKTLGLISVRLTTVAPVAKDTNLYTFKRVEGGPLPGYKPGAHIDLHLPIGLVRQFSLVVPNTDPEIYVVGVKRDAESRGGSRYIIDEMRVGHEIKISAPRNHFPLVESGESVVLIAGGIGITPIWCMTQELAAQDRPWQLYYSCRAREEMAFMEALKTLDPARVHLHLDAEADGKFLDLKAIAAAAPENAHLYCCGPKPMLTAFEAAAAGRPKGHVHIEYFTAKENEASTIGGFWVELARSSEEYYIPEGKKVLEVLYEAGVDVDYSCELGICGACETRVISGIPEHHDSVLSEEEQAANDKVMICCCGCKSERLVLDL
ncbi:MAG: PDR/VanB family oxidoreductase [Xanthobacteraceae bacterium]|jgi:ferredoxin-NADP reductase